MSARRSLRMAAAALVLALVLALATTIGARAAEPDRLSGQPAAAAGEILDSAGVKGGLIVHIGCGNGELTAALRANDSYLVHGLDADATHVEAARKHIQSLGLYGKVSAEQWMGKRLPYAENLVNLLVISDPTAKIAEAEIQRVLAPGGTALWLDPQSKIENRKLAKPRPKEIDEWTHALHDASNNAVSKDAVVGPPQHLQWICEPRNTRHHEAQASVTVAVSSGGRFFYVLDGAPTASILLPPQWQLVARDAFNGVLLWTRPIAGWESYLRPKSAGPPELSRRLVADGDRVYVTLGLSAPVTALDAAGGQTLLTYAETEGTEEILYRNGVLYLVVGARDAGKNDPVAAPAPAKGDRSPAPAFANNSREALLASIQDSRAAAPQLKNVMAVDADSARVLWKRTDVKPLPMSLAVSGERLFWLAADGLVCADARSGADLWRAKREAVTTRPPYSAPTLVVQGGVVLCADRRTKPGPEIDESTGKRIPAYLAVAALGDLVAYAVEDGRPLWTARCSETYCAPIDVLVNDGLVWLGQSRARHTTDYTVGMDPLTGEVRRRISPERAFESTMGHHRCYRDCATARYILAGRTGVEFIDLQSGEALRHHWVRGVCQYGVVPANGLLYAPPHSCACYIEAKLTGLLALAPARDEERGTNKEERGTKNESTQPPALEHGPAYAQTSSSPSVQALPPSEDWPTFRHDAARSGRASTAVAAELKCAWQARLGGRLSAPVIAEGRVLLASVDAHTIHALDAREGKPLWQYTAGGRIDSPPTIAQGLVVFGSADGWVYCLKATDGQLAWRHRVAPAERRLVAFGQLESAWPTQGSVLVHDGAVYCAAGRSSYLDGGIWLLRLDLKSGKKLAEHCVYSRDPSTGEQPEEPLAYEMPGALSDVLLCDGALVYMRHLAFDPRDLAPRKAAAHLYNPAGLLNDDWDHRSYWIYGEHFYSGYIGWYFAGRETPAGRLLAIDDAAIYGFGYKPQFYRGAKKLQYHLFAIDRGAVPPQPEPNYQRANRDYPQRAPGKFSVPLRWSQDVPPLARAMVLSGGRLFLVGPPNGALESQAVFDGARGAVLCAVSARDGQMLDEYQLDALPVFDGLAAAQGRLYLTLKDGRLLCLGDRRSTPGGEELPRPAATAADRP